MDFSEALTFLTRKNALIARAGWNGKGMFLAYVHLSHPDRTDLSLDIDGAKYPLHPFIVMKTAQGYLIPWLASQADLLAEDWEVVS